MHYFLNRCVVAGAALSFGLLTGCMTEASGGEEEATEFQSAADEISVCQDATDGIPVCADGVEAANLALSDIKVRNANGGTRLSPGSEGVVTARLTNIGKVDVHYPLTILKSATPGVTANSRWFGVYMLFPNTSSDERETFKIDPSVPRGTKVTLWMAPYSTSQCKGKTTHKIVFTVR